MSVPISQMTRSAILAALREDGFDLPPSPNPRTIASNLQAAARADCLVWGGDRIVSTLEGHEVDLRRVHPRRT
jgi:hypothetical protein